jgi:hypothetical protein
VGKVKGDNAEEGGGVGVRADTWGMRACASVADASVHSKIVMIPYKLSLGFDFKSP